MYWYFSVLIKILFRLNTSSRNFMPIGKLKNFFHNKKIICTSGVQKNLNVLKINYLKYCKKKFFQFQFKYRK